MAVQISSASHFNGNNQNIMHASASSPSYEPSTKRFKSADLTFQCIVCSDVYDDPNTLYEHMKINHQELYENDDGSGGENGCDSGTEHELSDEEYLDLSRLLEPICELRQVDDDDIDDKKDVPQNGHLSSVLNSPFGLPLNEEQLRLQLQFQMQLQNYLLQMQATATNTEARQRKKNDQRKPKENRIVDKPLSLRKKCKFHFTIKFTI